MKFIRKNGRIVPIRERKNLAIDFVSGVADGIVANTVKNKAVKYGFIGSGYAADLYTINKRYKQTRSIKGFLKKEAIGYGVGFIGTGIGYAGSALIKNLIRRKL